ncbi:ribose-phosphate pyrophosphokinase [Candidatus Peregrinibacteria bacterium]|nr:ribose-phosphate pyrophosphokinase [Candidatus Peregrinibacteria bacterium]
MPETKFKIFAGSSHPELAKEIATILKTPPGKTKLSTFSCGEKYVALEETVRGKEVFLVQTCRDQFVNEDFMELFLMCDAARLAFATKVHVIIPSFGYARQDKVHIPREPISAKLMANLLVASGADHIMTFELHADQTQAFFDVPVDNIKTHRLFAEYFKKKNLKNMVVVSPDAGGAKNAKKFADMMGASIAILHKTRPAHNVSAITHVVGDIAGKTCVIFDDMIDTAGSVVNAKTALLKAGAKKDVYLCATHAIFSGPAAKRLKEARFKEVVVTNSIPLSRSKQFSGLKQLSLAPLLASVIKSIITHKSASYLFY